MQKLKIKLNRSEQEVLLSILVNYDLSVFEDVLERQMIVYLIGEVMKRLGNHLRDNQNAEPWNLRLNPGEAAAMQLVMISIALGGYAANLSQKLIFETHHFLSNKNLHIDETRALTT